MLDLFPHSTPPDATKEDKVIKIIHCNTTDIDYIIKILDLAMEQEAKIDKDCPTFTIFTDAGRVLKELKEVGYPERCTYQGINLTLELII